MSAMHRSKTASLDSRPSAFTVAPGVSVQTARAQERAVEVTGAARRTMDSTDYFCEIMHELRRKDLLGSLKGRYQLMDTSTAKAGMTGRDVCGVEKILSGLVKLMYPHGEVTDEQLGELLEVALEGRQRVRNQLHLMAAGEYGPVVLSGRLVQSGKLITPRLADAEREQKVTLPSSPRVGEIIGLAVIGHDRGCLLHFEMQASKGSGRIINLGSMQKVMKESVAAAAQFIKTHAQDVGLPNDWQDNHNDGGA
jgi:ATP-dependent Lon protease